MKVILRKCCMLYHRGRMRISKFPPSRYYDCVTVPVKFLGLCHVCFFNCLFVCLFVFVVSSVETSFKVVPYQNA